MKSRGCGRNRDGVAAHNRSLVLGVIQAHEPVSRREIADITNLTTSTISNIVNRLMHDGFVTEAGVGKSMGGRTPRLLRLAGESHFAVAVDLSATDLLVALADIRGKILKRVRKNISTDPGTMTCRIIEAVQELESTAGIESAHIEGIGVTTPAIIEQKTGTVIKSVRLNWYNVPLGDMLQRHLEPPVFVGRDTHNAILGEQWYGAGKNVNDLLYVWVGSGIGIGVLLDGRIYTGATGMAGEFGHTAIGHTSSSCRCGNSGCLESLSSLEAIVSRVEHALTCGRESLLSRGPGSKVTPTEIFDAVDAGDPLACEIVEDAGIHLGTGIGNLINIFNPERVIIGGPVRSADVRLLAVLDEVARKRALPELSNTVTIALSQLGQDAGLVGATALVWSEVFGMR